MKDAVDGLFTPEPSPWLIRRLANQLEGLTQGDVKDALGRARIAFDFPAREQPISSRHVHVLEPESKPQRTKQRRLPRPKEVSDVSVQQLIDARLIAPPLELRRSYKGRELFGRIEPDGRVSFAGSTYNSLSISAGMARRSVIGDIPGRKYPPTNGWTFWRFRDSDGTSRELSVLRERLAEKNSRPTSPTA